MMEMLYELPKPDFSSPALVLGSLKSKLNMVDYSTEHSEPTVTNCLNSST